MGIHGRAYTLLAGKTVEPTVTRVQISLARRSAGDVEPIAAPAGNSAGQKLWVSAFRALQYPVARGPPRTPAVAQRAPSYR